MSPSPSVVPGLSERRWTLAGWKCKKKLEMATWARSRLLSGSPIRKIERPSGVPRKAFQTVLSMALDDQVLVRLDSLRSVDHQVAVTGQSHKKPGQWRRRRSARN